jgi:hypothetical protein
MTRPKPEPKPSSAVTQALRAQIVEHDLWQRHARKALDQRAGALGQRLCMHRYTDLIEQRADQAQMELLNEIRKDPAAFFTPKGAVAEEQE